MCNNIIYILDTTMIVGGSSCPIPTALTVDGIQMPARLLNHFLKRKTRGGSFCNVKNGSCDFNTYLPFVGRATTVMKAGKRFLSCLMTCGFFFLHSVSFSSPDVTLSSSPFLLDFSHVYPSTSIPISISMKFMSWQC